MSQAILHLITTLRITKLNHDHNNKLLIPQITSA